ncbi:hypothetical protein [Dryocola clanedunensis]
MKITDDDFLKAIWKSVAEHLPYAATHNYFGGKRGLVPNDWFYVRYSTHICTARRSNRIDLPIGNAASMNRIRKLIAQGLLCAEKHKPGDAFYFWLPDSLNKPAFELTLSMLESYGITKESVDGFGFDVVARKITNSLMSRFGDLPKQIFESKSEAA